MPTPYVVVVGDTNVDMVIRLPDRAVGADLSGSVPQLYGGGSASNGAVALARLGVSVMFVGAAGDDGYGRWVRDDLNREGVDTRGLRLVPDAFTPMVIALIQPDGERLIVVWPPENRADMRLTPDDIDADLIGDATWLHSTGICLRRSPAREALLHSLEIARRAGVPVSFDLNLRLELWGWGDDDLRRAVSRVVELANVIFGNAVEEIMPLAGAESVEAAALALADGQRTIVARQGSAGVLAASPQGEIMRCPAFPVGVVDTLGAGDAFDGGFIAARLNGADLPEALRWGNAVAALKIGQRGARGLPNRAQVEGMLKTL
jgi:fructokinase/2-dehydro-3-deoxygluconokinase